MFSEDMLANSSIQNDWQTETVSDWLNSDSFFTVHRDYGYGCDFSGHLYHWDPSGSKDSLCVQFQTKTFQHVFIVHNSWLAIPNIKRPRNLSFSTHTGAFWQKYPNSKVTDRPTPLFMTQSCPMSTSRQVWTHFPRIPTEPLCIAEHERRGVLL